MLQLVAGPIDGPQGDRVEAVGIEQRRLVVVAEDRHLALGDHLVQALARIGPVADNVAQAVDLADALRADVVEHDPERFQIGVNVADQGTLHAATSLDFKRTRGNAHGRVLARPKFNSGPISKSRTGLGFGQDNGHVGWASRLPGGGRALPQYHAFGNYRL